MQYKTIYFPPALLCFDSVFVIAAYSVVDNCKDRSNELLKMAIGSIHCESYIFNINISVLIPRCMEHYDLLPVIVCQMLSWWTKN